MQEERREDEDAGGEEEKEVGSLDCISIALACSTVSRVPLQKRVLSEVSEVRAKQETKQNDGHLSRGRVMQSEVCDGQRERERE